MDELSEEDKVLVARAVKFRSTYLQKFLSQPFFVAEQFTGIDAEVKEFFYSRGSAEIYGYLVVPKDFDSTKKYPVILHLRGVYGNLKSNTFVVFMASKFCE